MCCSKAVSRASAKTVQPQSSESEWNVWMETVGPLMQQAANWRHLGLSSFDDRNRLRLIPVVNLEKKASEMKSVRSLAWSAVFLGTVLTGSIAGVSGQPVELNIQMIPGIWISGATGAVNIEYTTNLDQTSGWTSLAALQATNTPYFYIDASATNSTKRFYRAVVEGGGNTNTPPGMVWIAPGTFTMGSPSTEVDRYSDEGPQTVVTLTMGFWMGKYEVTQREYLAVMGTNPSYFTGDLDCPVEQVSWDGAVAYCDQLTQRERAAGRLPAGYAYRLPTEAEWEYGCRAGTTTATAYGNSLSSAQANFNGNSPFGGAAKGPYLATTTKVGSYPANGWGLYDMHGNVWEWCLDRYGTYRGGSVTDPRGATTGSYRVNRGGGCYDFGGNCRSAIRYYLWPDNTSGDMGFRPVLAQVSEPGTAAAELPGAVQAERGTRED